jgi:hypothetical protein
LTRTAAKRRDRKAEIAMAKKYRVDTEMAMKCGTLDNRNGEAEDVLIRKRDGHAGAPG